MGGTAASTDRACARRGGDPELFQTINKAYDVLSDPERRKYYDRTGRLERTVEEDFLDGFGAKPPSRDRAKPPSLS